MVPSDKEGSSHHEGVGRPNRTSGQKFKRHCARFWWVHLIILIIIVLVVTLPVIYVAYPNIAQDGVNNSELVVTKYVALNPAPNALDLELDSLFISKSRYHPNLDAFNATLSLKGRDEPFVSFEIPAIKARNGTEAQVKQRVQITNMNEFTRYTETVLGSKEYTVELKGKGKLKLGSLPKTTVDYDQEVTQKGFDGLSSLEILSLTLLEHGFDNGTNTIGKVSIDNPTVMTLEMGNISLAMTGPAPAKLPLGDGALHDVTLRPGKNILDIYVIANQTSIVTVTQIPKYHCGVFPMEVRGSNVTYDGKILPYFTTALAENVIKTTLNVSETFRKAGYGFVIGECS